MIDQAGVDLSETRLDLERSFEAAKVLTKDNDGNGIPDQNCFHRRNLGKLVLR
jgi:hypothetical protein